MGLDSTVQVIFSNRLSDYRYCLLIKRLLQLKQNNAKHFQNIPKTFCFGFVSALHTCEAKQK